MRLDHYGCLLTYPVTPLDQRHQRPIALPLRAPASNGPNPPHPSNCSASLQAAFKYKCSPSPHVCAASFIALSAFTKCASKEWCPSTACWSTHIQSLTPVSYSVIFFKSTVGRSCATYTANVSNHHCLTNATWNFAGIRGRRIRTAWLVVSKCTRKKSYALPLPGWYVATNRATAAYWLSSNCFFGFGSCHAFQCSSTSVS